MAPRPTWNGHLKLSLVNCAVSLFPATSTAERDRLQIKPSAGPGPNARMNLRKAG